jgi:hypothetical protein
MDRSQIELCSVGDTVFSSKPMLNLAFGLDHVIKIAQTKLVLAII